MTHDMHVSSSSYDMAYLAQMLQDSLAGNSKVLFFFVIFFLSWSR
jgi:hypothetical protein